MNLTDTVLSALCYTFSTIATFTAALDLTIGKTFASATGVAANIYSSAHVQVGAELYVTEIVWFGNTLYPVAK